MLVLKKASVREEDEFTSNAKLEEDVQDENYLAHHLCERPPPVEGLGKKGPLHHAHAHDEHGQVP